jgi:hypothetical protein
VSPVKYELGSYTPEEAILHSHCREHLKSYTVNKAVYSITGNDYKCLVLKQSSVTEITHLILASQVEVEAKDCVNS